MSYSDYKKIGNYMAMTVIGVPVTAVVLAGMFGAFDAEDVPDDSELVTLFGQTFPELSQAIENQGQTITTYDEEFADIHDHMLSNQQEGDYLRLSSMGVAADLFNEAAFDGLYMRSLICNGPEEQGSAFRCTGYIAEKGGIVQPGNEAFPAVSGCMTVRYNALVIPGEDGFRVSINGSNVNEYEHRIDPAEALHGHVDMSQFSEDNPHTGPMTLEDITISRHVRFHELPLRAGPFSWGSFVGTLGEGQLEAELVLARFSECIRGHEITGETITDDTITPDLN